MTTPLSDAELVERLRALYANGSFYDDSAKYAATRIEALLRERDEAREAGRQSALRAMHVTLDVLGAPKDEWPCNRIATFVRFLGRRVTAAETALAAERAARERMEKALLTTDEAIFAALTVMPETQRDMFDARRMLQLQRIELRAALKERADG